MSNKNILLKAGFCATTIFLAQIVFALPVLDLNNKEEIQEAANQYLVLPKKDSDSARSFLSNPLYAYQIDDKELFNKAYQFKKLVDNDLITIQDGRPVFPDAINILFLKAFNQSKPDSAEKLEFLINAYTSELFKSNKTVKHLVLLADSLYYGTKVQMALHAGSNNNLIKNQSLFFLGNWPAYYFFKIKKPHIAKFLLNTWSNGAVPSFYNAPEPEFVETYYNSFDYYEFLKNLPSAMVRFILNSFSCDPANEYLQGHIKLLEFCKVNNSFDSMVHTGINFDTSFNLTAEINKDTNLIPVNSYKKIIPDKERYEGYNSLYYLLEKIVTDRTEGALFYVLFKGAVKYQFFSIGTYREHLSLTYVVDDNLPTPILNFLMPLKEINIGELADGIYTMLNQDKDNEKNIVPDLQGVWLIKGQ